MPDFTGKLSDDEVVKLTAFIQGVADWSGRRTCRGRRRNRKPLQEALDPFRPRPSLRLRGRVWRHAISRARGNQSSASSCRPRAAIDTLGTATGVTPSCVGPGAKLGGRRHEILAADQRPLADGSSSSPPRGTGRARRARSRRARARGRCVRRAPPDRRAVDRGLGRREARASAPRAAPRASPRPAAAAARLRCARPARAGGSMRRSPCGRRSPLRGPVSAASTTAFTSPCRAGTTSAAGTGAFGTVIGWAIRDRPR